MIDRSQLGSMKNDLCVDSLAHLQLITMKNIRP